MQGIILAGGKGTRLQRLYPSTPKALVPVAGKPFIQRQIEWLTNGGLTSVHIAAGYLAEKISEWADTTPFPGVHLSLSREPSTLGTAGALKYVEPFIKEDIFFILNGDSILPELDFRTMIHLHSQCNAEVTIAITSIQSAGRYGTVKFDESGWITAFLEKSVNTAGWINGGVYAMHRSVFKRITADTEISLENDIFPQLAEERQLASSKTKPPLLDMGTPEGLAAMESFFVRSES